MSKEEILDKIKKAVIEGDADACKKLAEEALKAEIDPYKAIAEGYSAGMLEVGGRYLKGETFLPDLLMSSEAMYAGIDVLKPHIRIERIPFRGKVVLGVVEGDPHDIGKNILKVLLEARGFEVFDLGRDVSPDEFVARVKEVKADIVAMSSLMTTTAPHMKDVIDMLEKEGLRDRVKVLVGGSATSEAFAKSIGADGWKEDALTGAEFAEELLKRIRKERGSI